MPADKADCTVTVKDADFVKIMSGKMNPQTVSLFHLGRVVRKPANANPGLKVNRSINFSCMKVFLPSCFLFSLRLFKFEREGQTI